MILNVENEKKFEYYFGLPAEIRMMILNEIPPIDRCRFTRCSKLCGKEVKYSKDFNHGLFLEVMSENLMKILVYHGDPKYGKSGGSGGFILEFRKISGKMFKIYRNMYYQTFWEEELDGSKEMIEYMIDEYKNILKYVEKVINGIDIYEFEPYGRLKNIDFGIERLNKLEYLQITGHVDIFQFFSKLRKPLRTLMISEEENSQILENCEQIYQVRELISWRNTRMTNEQFLRISAKNVYLSIGQLTENNVFDFIRSWQNGTIGKEIGSYKWLIEGSKFNKGILSKLLGKYDPDNQLEEIEIKNYKDAGRVATLHYTEYYVEFKA